MNSSIQSDLVEIKKILGSRGQTLSLAESCTGGLVSSWLAQLPGVSDVFVGSVVSYANSVKTDVLHVPESMILAHGAVSSPVALAMARGIKKVLDSDWSVSLTGIAGPTGGTPEKPVGTVFIAVVGPGIEKVNLESFGNRSRVQIQEDAAAKALRHLIESLKN